MTISYLIFRNNSIKYWQSLFAKKGFQVFYKIGELVDGTRATGENTFCAGQSDRAPSTQNVAASALTPYEPIIDPELINLSLETGRVLGEEIVHNIPLVMFIH
jgi:hypothetical protein